MSIDFSKKVNEVHSSLSDHSSAHSKNSQVLALKGSYHGDNLGAMEAQAPSSYTGFLQRPWYEFSVTRYLKYSKSVYLYLNFWS
ncbi:unnamed protein product [Prunus armeniaca]